MKASLDVILGSGASPGKLMNAMKNAAMVVTKPVKTTGSRPYFTSLCPRIPKHNPPMISPTPTKIPCRPKKCKKLKLTLWIFKYYNNRALIDYSLAI